MKLAGPGGHWLGANRMPHALWWLPYTSCLYYLFELIMSNELLGPGKVVLGGEILRPDAPRKPVPGDWIVMQQLGFLRYTYGGGCPRGWGGSVIADHVDGQISACWVDLFIPATCYVIVLLVSCFLLKYVARYEST